MIKILKFELEVGYVLPNGVCIVMSHVAMCEVANIINKDYPDWLYVSHNFVRNFDRGSSRHALFDLYIYIQKVSNA